jgi:glycosyltransferase involved in cell wall biosynthesis
MVVPPGAKLMIIVPAYNEAGAVGSVVEEIRQVVPGIPVVVIDDCSLDSTVAVAEAAGASVLPLPHHLGLGGCVQAGYKLAFELGYEYVIRIDGDGQHDPRYIPNLYGELRKSGVEMVIASRFVAANGSQTTFLRTFGIRFFRAVLRPILGRTVHDPTSGYVGVNREALEVFSKSFPLEYPEIEALVVLRRKDFRFSEISCTMRKRMAGRSSLRGMRTFYYIVHVLLGVLVNVLLMERPPWRGRGD